MGFQFIGKQLKVNPLWMYRSIHTLIHHSSYKPIWTIFFIWALHWYTLAACVTLIALFGISAILLFFYYNIYTFLREGGIFKLNIFLKNTKKYQLTLICEQLCYKKKLFMSHSGAVIIIISVVQYTICMLSCIKSFIL